MRASAREIDQTLTGSALFDPISGMSQSPADRIELLPLAEIQGGDCLPPRLDRSLLNGGYPASYGGEDSHEQEHCLVTGWKDVGRG